MLMKVVSDLDHRLFNSYIKAKLVAPVALLRSGILAPDMDWYDTPHPKGMILMVVFLVILY